VTVGTRNVNKAGLQESALTDSSQNDRLLIGTTQDFPIWRVRKKEKKKENSFAAFSRGRKALYT